MTLRVAITGATGLVGKRLCADLEKDGHKVIRVVRKAERAEDVAWDPAKGTIDTAGLAGCDGVVHLAGESIAKGRWTAAKKRRILDSRVQGTKLVAETLAKMEPHPAVWVSASAIGYYGDRGEELLREDSQPGKGFLPDVCKAWEEATRPAENKGIRIVRIRIGVVLAKDGGALAAMLTPFKLGVGGVMGSGKQYMSWIAIDDLIGAIRHCMDASALSGPVNAVAPQAATNYEFTKALGKAIHRPTILPMPAFAARLALGQMADDLLLASTRVEPARLRDAGYTFRFPTLDAALKGVLV